MRITGTEYAWVVRDRERQEVIVLTPAVRDSVSRLAAVKPEQPEKPVLGFALPTTGTGAPPA